MEIDTSGQRTEVYLRETTGTGVVAVQVWVKVGSRYEDDRIAGITHFIEHLIFKGTEKGGGYEIAPRIEALGGSINAFTSYDNTVYHIVVPKDAFETGLELLVGAVKSPLFPEKELEKEKKVVIEEIKMGEDEPQRKLFKELFALSYAGHPYGRPIIGFEDTVSAISRADILSYFKTHYTIDNVVAVIVGDFDEKRAKRASREAVCRDEAATGKGRQGPGRRGRGRRWDKSDRARCEGKLSRHGFAIPSLNHEDIPALEVLSKDTWGGRQFSSSGGTEAQTAVSSQTPRPTSSRRKRTVSSWSSPHSRAGTTRPWSRPWTGSSGGLLPTASRTGRWRRRKTRSRHPTSIPRRPCREGAGDRLLRHHRG